MPVLLNSLDHRTDKQGKAFSVIEKADNLRYYCLLSYYLKAQGNPCACVLEPFNAIMCIMTYRS